MNSSPLSSDYESKNDTVVTQTNPLPASVQAEENQASETEDNNGFTVISKKKRVPPIFVNESVKTPNLLKELSGKNRLHGFRQIH
ncbi:hypothetical protein NPIL_353241 [Nephila pilipes]|uniref:Uncharacterized protein n=1 Tax=Nephila pilipes TaxID=299642 RepID=A0A8X6QIX8_NEPPI|nr:hypothetical protein NPIL_353241 [Nephila pilipes]